MVKVLTYDIPDYKIKLKIRQLQVMGKKNTRQIMVHSLSTGKCKMFLCAACHSFTPHVNAWKNLIGIVVQIQARG